VAIRKRAIAADGTKVERRRTRRFNVSVPIEVSWSGANGVAMKEEAIARQVNVNGGFLEMSVYPDLGCRVTLANFLSAQTADGRVLATPYTREGVSGGIIIELVTPSENFWGVSFQVKKASVKLQDLEKALQSEGIDLRLLKEYRDAVDFIRTASGAVQQLREFQLRGLDDSEPLNVVTAERIRRTMNLCLEVITDLDAGRIKEETKGVEELYRSVEQMRDRLRRVLRIHNGLGKT
jgi:hypothetical protein